MVSYCVRRFIHLGIASRSTALKSPSVIKKATKLENKETAHGNNFVDWIRIRAKAGSGGDGGISMLSLCKNEFAGPDGGNGGTGGHVIFKATRHRNSLSHLKKVIEAPNGVNGGACDMEGKNAAHKIIDVPMGTLFRNLNREIVAEVDKEGSMFLAARGGEGGKGNAFFKSSDQQKPLIAEKGGQGEAFTFDIELRSMAEVGLIGFPNAGKSTLLRAISRARPKVASYPFTTLRPHIGMVPYQDGLQIPVADIPGIVKDAHKDNGMGISFLRHIERCKCLLFVIDMAQPDPLDQLNCLKYELEQYLPGLSERPSGIIANKIDLDEARQNVEKFGQSLDSEEKSHIFLISAKHNQNIYKLLSFIRDLRDKNTNRSFS